MLNNMGTGIETLIVRMNECSTTKHLRKSSHCYKLMLPKEPKETASKARLKEFRAEEKKNWECDEKVLNGQELKL